ncbi:hypothetical protein ASPCAL05277 [Aspergillus calidoustus]|uniref:Uncharacterized protein n=1 Tax=Aspergillus calidoustus TaxID=454130 RepID=A0A0U5FX55_ASPCI|nr:hypothetical protein ASPCAL05277 [Aspergillus calidoustus]
MSSNQLVPYTLTEPSPDPSCAPPQRTQPTPDKCSSLSSLCDECRLQYGEVSRDVKSGYLVCPKGSYPVILTFEFLGTPYKARELVEYFHGRVAKMFNCEDMPVYGAVKRLPNGTDGPGSWLDLTTPGAKFAKAFKPNKGYFTLPSFEDAIDAGLQAEYSKVHSKVRQVSILADIPFTISPGGEIETMMVSQILPKWVDKKAMQHPNAGHPSLHRLKWWAETHPHAEPKEPTRRTLNPDPWQRTNVQVRKKKH